MIITFDDLKAVIEAGNLELLLEYHVNLLNLVPHRGANSLLQQACLDQAESCVEYLLDQRVDLDYRNDDGNTALHCAVYRQHQGIVRRLLERGAKLNIRNNKGRTPTDELLSGGFLSSSSINFDLLELLVDSFDKEDSRSMKNLLVVLLKLNSASPDDNKLNQLINKVVPLTGDGSLDQALIECMGKRGCGCGCRSKKIPPNLERFEQLLRVANMNNIRVDLSKIVLVESNVKLVSIIKILLKVGLRETSSNSCSLLEVIFRRCGRDQEISWVMKYIYANPQLVSELEVNRICTTDHVHHSGKSSKGSVIGYLLGNSEISDEKKVEYMEYLITKCGLDVNNVDPYYWLSSVSELLLDRLIAAGAKLTQPIGEYSRSHQKRLTIKFNLALNKTEPIDGDSIDEIVSDNFIFLEQNGGIAWDMENLVNYVIQISKGENKFTTDLKIDGGLNLKDKPIWSEYDYKQLKKHPLGEKIEIFLDVSKYAKYFTRMEIEFLNQSASIFWADGDYWDETLEKILTVDELAYWNSIKDRRSRTGMPNMSNMPEVETKLYHLKSRQIYLFRQYYIPLSDEKKKVMEEYTGGAMSVVGTMIAINGRECIMCYGSSLSKSCIRFNQLIPYLSSDLSSDLETANIASLNEITINGIVTNGKEDDYER